LQSIDANIVSYSKGWMPTLALISDIAGQLHTYTLIPTVYRALLKSAVSGTSHRIHH